MVDLTLAQPGSNLPYEIGKWLLLAAGALFIGYVTLLAVLLAISGLRGGEARERRAVRD